MSEQCRWRPRTLDYQALLPYPTESRQEQLVHLDRIISSLYVAIEGNDLNGIMGASTASAIVHWTRELRAWIDLKFDIPLDIRINLSKLYYDLALCGVDATTMDKFVNMFVLLCKDDLFQHKVEPQHLNLDWQLLVLEMKKLTVNSSVTAYDGSISKSFQALSKLAQASRPFFSAESTMAIVKDILPSVRMASFFYEPVLTLILKKK